ncbi:MAG: glycosyltransferase family 4 protein, partial [Thermoplasmata archaeon]
REWEPDVIHAHSHRYGHVLQSAILARARRTPLIVSMHYHPADRREPAWKVGMLRVQDVGFGMSAYRVARFLVVESQHEARLVAAFAPARRIRIISPGIDLESWRSEPREAPEHLPESYVLYAGRIASNKGLSTLFEAYALLPPSTRLPLVVMGPDWGERPTLQAHAERLGLRHDVVWVDPARDQRTYRRVFFGARLFVLPSEYEAFGLVLLEAMAAGIPILASRVGAVPEVLENGASGRLVDYGDPAGLAQGMQAVLTDPQVARGLVARASQRVESFTWERTVDQLESLYREVTGAT